MHPDPRDVFDLPEGAHYLNAAYMTPLPRQAEEAGIAGVRRKRWPGAVRASDFFEESERLRPLFAGLVGAAEPERVAILPSVSYGLATVAANTPLGPGDEIVLVEGEFPSNVLIWRRRAAEIDARIVTVAAPPAGPGRSRAWNDAIDGAIGERTAVVGLSHVHWADGTLFDLPRVGARARSVGATFVVDGTQSIGALPFDLSAIGADAVVCAGYKWLFGPYSLGFGWYGPKFDGGRPLEENWIARARSDDFRGLVDYVDEYRPGATRYDVGERSNFVLVPMALAALELVSAWTPSAIAAWCRSVSRPLVDGAPGLGLVMDDADGRAAHLFGFALPDGADPDALVRELEARRVHVSVRGQSVRVSPHVYNTADDVRALVDAVEAVLGSRAR